jgi:hypothetical protein
LSCAGRGLCDGLITRPEESYRVSNSVWLRNLKGGGQGPIWALEPLDGWSVHNTCNLTHLILFPTFTPDFEVIFPSMALSPFKICDIKFFLHFATHSYIHFCSTKYEGESINKVNLHFYRHMYPLYTHELSTELLHICKFCMALQPTLSLFLLCIEVS